MLFCLLITITIESIGLYCSVLFLQSVLIKGPSAPAVSHYSLSSVIIKCHVS